jgi:hypothetical protein
LSVFCRSSLMLPRRDLQQKYLRLSVLLDANPN